LDNVELEMHLIDRLGFAITSLQLRNYIVDFEIGVLEKEQGVKQRIRFDVDIFIAGASKPSEDEIDQVLDYDFIRSSISNKVTKERINLLESLVADLLDTLLIPNEVIACSATATKLDVYSDESQIGCRMIRIKEDYS
tara:strand:- start:817 stop:1230 length:414 start_codon:yes stop_codon:yes gene_type:complete